MNFLKTLTSNVHILHIYKAACISCTLQNNFLFPVCEKLPDR